MLALIVELHQPKVATGLICVGYEVYNAPGVKTQVGSESLAIVKAE
jgi:hypothetical protein